MRIRKTTRHGRVLYEVDAGKVDGKRRRFFYRTEKEAKRKAKEIETTKSQVGHAWAAVETRDKADTLLVLNEIKNNGLTVREVWDYYRRENTGTGRTVMPLDRAADEYLKAKQKENLRQGSLDNMKSQVGKLCRKFTDWNVHEISTEHISAHLNESGNTSSRESVYLKLQTFMRWCQSQQYRTDDPFSKLKKPRVDGVRPVIFSVAQAKKLMVTCAKLEPELIPSFALKLFAGVRPDEAGRLVWKDYHKEHGELVIDSAAAKTRDIRIVKLPKNCQRWLSQHRKKTGLIQPTTNFRKRFDRVRESAGLSKAWAKDILRHTAASFYYHTHGAVETSKSFGHSEDILFKHYRAQVNDRDCAKFWAIVPK